MGLLLALAAIGLFVLTGKRPTPGEETPGGGGTPPSKPGGGGGKPGGGAPGTPGEPSGDTTKPYTLSSSDTVQGVANRFGTTIAKIRDLNPALQWKNFHITVLESFNGRRNSSVDEVTHPKPFKLIGRIDAAEWPVYSTTADSSYYTFPSGYDNPGVVATSMFGRIYSEGGSLNKYVLGWGPKVVITVPAVPDA